MIRILEQQIHTDNKKYIEAFGLSTDSKPTADLVTGSVFVEVDTSKAYFFNESGSEWVEAGGSNG